MDRLRLTFPFLLASMRGSSSTWLTARPSSSWRSLIRPRPTSRLASRLIVIHSHIAKNIPLNRVELSSITRVKFACSKLLRSRRNIQRSSSLVCRHHLSTLCLWYLITPSHVVRKFKIFNTNNLWLNLKGLRSSGVPDYNYPSN